MGSSGAARATAASPLVSALTSPPPRPARAQLSLPLASGGEASYFGVYDGHGGNATAQWLATSLGPMLAKRFQPARAADSVTDVFLAADEELLAPQGFMGMGARGIGGPKCGSTGLVALLCGDTLTCANVGDARALLVSRAASEEPQQLSVDHVPDNEQERYRIEVRPRLRGPAALRSSDSPPALQLTNPNRKKPLVVFVGDTWRVGGLLALSRAFGDAYMKASGQFEGYGTAEDDYRSGFGVIAKPHVATVQRAAAEETFLVLSSDGLYANEVRGGGGGLTNAQVGDLVRKLPAAASAAQLTAMAQELAEGAVAGGSTDDVTVLIVRW